jgi:2'-5' RNA ligase
VRAFLAVQLNAALREPLAGVQDELRRELARGTTSHIRVTWVKPEALHLTVKFLGEIDEAVASALHDSIAAVVSGQLSFEIPIERLGAFPRPQAPRAVWAGPAGDWESHGAARTLFGLVQRIDAACARQAGVPKDEHQWRPHLTLARIRDGERAAGRALMDSGVFERPWPLPALGVRAMTLTRSELLPDGPRHTDLWTVA